MPLLDLPREVLLHILKLYMETESQSALMKTVFKVNKAFSNLCLDSALWEAFDGSLKLKNLMLLLKHGSLSEAKSFTICKKDELTEDDAYYIFRNLSNLDVVDLSQLKNLKLSSQKSKKDKTSILDVIAENCHKLTKISLSKPEKVYSARNSVQYTASPKNLNYQTLSPFLTVRGNDITSLDISYCRIVNLPLVLRCIADCCPNLEELYLVSTHTSAAFPTKYVQKKCQKLKVLCLDYNVRPSRERHQEGFPHLNAFSYFDPSGNVLHDQEFLSILFNSPKLSTLNISTCSLSSGAVCQLPTVGLEYLNLSKSKACICDLEAVLEKWCHSLKELNLAYCKSSSINTAVSKLISLPEKSPLEVLNLSYTMVEPGVIKGILEKCDNLKTLHLESCRSLTRGMKRAYYGSSELDVLRKNINLVKNLAEND